MGNSTFILSVGAAFVAVFIVVRVLTMTPEERAAYDAARAAEQAAAQKEDDDSVRATYSRAEVIRLSDGQLYVCSHDPATAGSDWWAPCSVHNPIRDNMPIQYYRDVHKIQIGHYRDWPGTKWLPLPAAPRAR